MLKLQPDWSLTLRLQPYTAPMLDAEYEGDRPARFLLARLLARPGAKQKFTGTGAQGVQGGNGP